ncbi:MAG: hypothetical protein C6W56_02655 [Caldibacillus debilis]|nr:MAG: hypothetical protein C6W56_02655 [Caldibacillus debilis]
MPEPACGIFVTVGFYRKNDGPRPILRLRGPFVLKQKKTFPVPVQGLITRRDWFIQDLSGRGPRF